MSTRPLYEQPQSLEQALCLADLYAQLGRYEDAGRYSNWAAWLAECEEAKCARVARLYTQAAHYRAKAALRSPRHTKRAIAAAQVAARWQHRANMERLAQFSPTTLFERAAQVLDTLVFNIGQHADSRDRRRNR